MNTNSVFNACDFQTYITGQGDEPTPITSATETITTDEIRNTIDGLDATGQVYAVMLDRDGLRVRANDNYIDVDSVYPSIISRYVHDSMSREECAIYTHEREEIINILKREKNVNTRKCMYVDDLVKEIAKIMEVRL